LHRGYNREVERSTANEAPFRGAPSRDDLEIRVGPSDIAIHFDDRVLVTDPAGCVRDDAPQGFFAADTRLVSEYDVRINGAKPVLLNSAAVSTVGARYEYTNDELVAGSGCVEAHTLHLRIDRSVRHVLREDYSIVNSSKRPAEIVLDVRIGSDFADLFDVKEGKLVRRGRIESQWADDELRATYRNEQFVRGLVIRVDRAESAAQYANGALTFHFQLPPKRRWHACLLWIPVLDGNRASADDNGHALEVPPHVDVPTNWAQFRTSDTSVTAVVTHARRDLAGLRIRAHGVRTEGPTEPWVPAAGIPWFVSVFGRDALVTSLQTMALSPRLALGTLDALAALQADGYDDWRDMQPGKIPHELRHGELAALRRIPQLPYYGTSDATPLFVRAVAEAWDWHGDRTTLDRLRPHVERALRWIDTDGDLDGDGFQEYRTRSSQGYYNQSWKDSGQAIIHADGTPAPLPIATCELQGYVVAAKEAWARVLEDAYDEDGRARALRDEAARLRDAIEARFWWDDERTYYLGLDGDKRPIESVASNPGHLLWTHAIAPERAACVADRLMADDMWSGWGIRTLSSGHPAYNPMSYQRGAVWPHDNGIVVAGLLGYGFDVAADAVARGVFDAAARFQHQRPPEVFAGFDREPASFPVQYLGANVPQAWASGSTIHIVSAFLGLAPHASAQRMVVAPRLPTWLDAIDVHGLGVGDARVDVTVRRDGDTVRADARVTRGSLEVTCRRA
jgi:glycogen debranching enzyme